MTLRVLCKRGHSNLLIAGSRAFWIGWSDSARVFISRAPVTKQAASFLKRLRYRKGLQGAIDDKLRALASRAP